MVDWLYILLDFTRVYALESKILILARTKYTKYSNYYIEFFKLKHKRFFNTYSKNLLGRSNMLG